MATPEWEEVEIWYAHGDDYYPRFSKSDLRGYRRPAWFVNAPLMSSRYLIAELCGEHSWRQRAIYFLLQKLVQFSEKLNRLRGGRAIQLVMMDPHAFFYRLSRSTRREDGRAEFGA